MKSIQNNDLKYFEIEYIIKFYEGYMEGLARAYGCSDMGCLDILGGT